MAGMVKGSGTRSGLLWEVERLLNECEELPQVLFMENVPEVVSQKNIKDFRDWIKFLNSKGYSSKYQILNAKDYGVPQNRSRCYMFSFLGDYDYNFPKPIKLKTKVKDLLENQVPEKYYIKKDTAQNLINDLVIKDKLKEVEKKEVMYTYNHGEEFIKFTDISRCCMARDYKGLQTYGYNEVIEKHD